MGTHPQRHSPAMRRAIPVRGAALALAAAVLFGINAPFGKVLVRNIAPLVLAGLLYVGASIALILFALARRLVGSTQQREAPLQWRDAPALLGTIVSGGVLGPFLLLVGLSRTSGLVASLLLNLEAVFTLLVAVVLGEHLGRRQALACAFIVGGSALLTAETGAGTTSFVGALAVAGACFAWALDNNLTRLVALRDPVAVVRMKSVAAGAISLSIAGALSQPLRMSHAMLLSALTLGAVSYGASLVLYVRAQRDLGAARVGAFFACAPFVGAAMAIPVLRETPTLLQSVAAVLLASGVWQLLREEHFHHHVHQPLDHEHAHVHDEHHQHAHHGEIVEPHSHAHRHEPVAHGHPHVPDIHHRHPHSSET